MKNRLLSLLLLFPLFSEAQSVTKTIIRIPDTGANKSYTTTFGEDNDYNINVPFFIDNQNGTVTDTVTGLMWQKTDGGEMTIENAIIYADTLTLGGFTDWRLPSPLEAFSILNLQNVNPSLNTSVFTKTLAEYWWTNTYQYNNASQVWCINAGGGIGNKPKIETISAGGTKHYHVLAVRDRLKPQVINNRYLDNLDGTITDNLTDLIWQKVPNVSTLAWEDALNYAEGLSLANNTNWRLPNIKELQSITDFTTTNPAVNTAKFGISGTKKFWSSTSLPNQTTKAWFWDTQFGITTYDLKTVANYVLCVSSKPESVTGIADENFNQLKLMAYPNPTDGIIYLNANVDLIRVYNVLGNEISTSLNTNKIDLTVKKSGVYIFKILVNDKLETFKVTRL